MDQKRRRVLKTTGTAALGFALAGCLGGGDGGADNTETDTPEPTDTPEDTEMAGNMTNETAGNETAGDMTNETNGTAESDFLDIGGDVETSPGLEVVDRELYNTDAGAGLRGTVENTGDQAFTYVEAQATVYDDAGEILFEFIDEAEEADLDGALEPGGTWKFDVTFEEAEPDAITDYTLEVNGFVGVETTTGANVTGNFTDAGFIVPITSLDVVERELYRTNGEVGIRGTIENTSDQTFTYVAVEVTLYDDAGDLIGDFIDEAEEADLEGGLEPGGTWEFDVLFEEADPDDIVRYTIDIENAVN